MICALGILYSFFKSILLLISKQLLLFNLVYIYINYIIC